MKVKEVSCRVALQEPAPACGGVFSSQHGVGLASRDASL